MSEKDELSEPQRTGYLILVIIGTIITLFLVFLTIYLLR